MRSIDLDRRRLDRLRSRFLGGRTSVQVVVGALAIAAIVLAFLFRPGQASQDAKPTSTPVKPTAAAAAPAVPTAAPVIVAVPTATVALPAPTAKERTHTVEGGDNLSKIAEKYYNDASKWSKIAEANKDVLPNPNTLQVGQKLRIPD